MPTFVLYDLLTFGLFFYTPTEGLLVRFLVVILFLTDGEIDTVLLARRISHILVHYTAARLPHLLDLLLSLRTSLS